MKVTTVYALIWFMCTMTIIVSIIVSKSLAPLWALFIPALINFESGD